ncbi:MAG: ABC transporter substrate-binding protein [Actinobacteria bacterium]|nr:ABC transporter substrate-binding protein [Actinomycetota bacterium]
MRSSKALQVKVASLLALASIAPLVTGCGGNTAGTSSGGGTTGGASAEPRQGGTLAVSLGEEILSVNPLKAYSAEDVNVVSQMFETVFKENYEGKVVPWLLEGFKPSKNDTVWTLQLKKGVDFSTGKPMTSADVKWSLERGMEVETVAGVVAGWEKIEAPSPTTVVITTSRPAPEMPEILSAWSFSVMPKDWGGESEKQFNEHPIGTGPFEFASRKKGESLTLKKNANYWVPQRPYLDEVVYHTVQNPESRTAQIRGGQLDMAYNPPFPEIETLEASPELTVEAPYLGIGWLMILNTEEPLFENRKAREAVNYALDRESMVELALHGNGKPMNAYLLPWLPGYAKNLKATEHNPERAKELLAEAEKEGVKPTFEISSMAEDPFWTQASQIAQANLEEVGFTVVIKKSDLSSLLGQLENREFDATTIYNTALSPYPAELFSFYNATGGFFTGVDTKETEKLMAAAQSETDTAKRNAMWAHIQQIISEEQALMQVAYSPYVWVKQSDVTGSFIGRTGILWLGQAGFAS